MALLPSTEVRRTFGRLLKYVRPYRFVILPAVIATSMYAVFSGTIPFFMQDVFQRLGGAALDVSDAANRQSPWRIPLLIAVVFALRGAMDFLTVYGLNWVGRSAVRDLRGELFSRYLHLPAAYYDRHATGDLISKLTFNSELVAEAISGAVVVIVRDSLLVIVMFGVMLSFSFRLTLVLAVVGPAIALLINAMSRAFRRHSTRIQDSMGDATRAVGQALSGHRIIKIFGAQGHEQARFDGINRRNFRLNLRLVGTRALGDSLTQYVAVLGVAGIIFLVFSGWLEGIDSPGFVGFITTVGILMPPLKRLVNTNAVLQRGIAAAQSLFDVLDEPAEPSAAGEPVERSHGNIEYRHVSFRYGDETAAKVLTDVSFRAGAGTTTAFVGRSGSGKSTLVGLLPRFYDVTAGEILLDGKNIESCRLEDLRRQVGFVGQDVVLFDDTIAGNIAYGALAGCSRADIERVAEAAFVTEFVDDMPEGLETRVGERGLLLSGGQRQRIAIARALLKDAPILILDEATSALDTESERKVQEALARLMSGRTTLVIAHRLSTVESADQIIVMKDGRIVETGTHAELIAKDGQYAALYRMQFAD